MSSTRLFDLVRDRDVIGDVAHFPNGKVAIAYRSSSHIWVTDSIDDLMTSLAEQDGGLSQIVEIGTGLSTKPLPVIIQTDADQLSVLNILDIWVALIDKFGRINGSRWVPATTLFTELRVIAEEWGLPFEIVTPRSLGHFFTTHSDLVSKSFVVRKRIRRASEYQIGYATHPIGEY